MRLLYPEAVSRFDIARAPGMTNAGGGMGTKASRVEEVLRQRYPDVRRVSALEEVDSDAVIVDALWFVNDYEGKVESFLNRKFRFSMLYGSQECILSWPAKYRAQLLAGITCVTHNCEYQRAMYRSCGIFHSQYLCDPVPEHIFYAAPKVQRVFASGQISWEKNTRALIELYRALQGSGIETCYMGSATMWGENVSSSAMSMRYRLESELQSVTDIFHGNLSQAEVAKVSNTSMHHVHVAHYDCSCQNQQEAALGGAVLWGLKHPINMERPVFAYAKPRECAKAMRLFIDTNQKSTQVREFAERNWSYAAFLRQFDKILQGV